MKNVLCVIDPTSSDQPALRRAAWYAKKTRSRLDLLICDYDGFLDGRGSFDSAPLKRARARFMDLHYDRLNELANDYRDADLDVRVEVVWDHPLYEGIVRYACASGAEIVFKDSHPHRGFGLHGLSNSDWSLIRTCPAPLWMVKPVEFPEQPQLVAAIDPLHEHDKPAALDDEILRISKSIADLSGGDVHAFHSYNLTMTAPQLKADGMAPIFTPSLIVEERIRQQHSASLEEITKQHGISNARTHLLSGQAHETLPTLVSDIHASLVVMGAVARNRLQRIFIGSTAERTLERISCDLLVVKPAWFETTVALDVDSAA